MDRKPDSRQDDDCSGGCLMHFTLADLHHYVRPEDRQLLDVIEMRM